jgi:hypothetical protein
LRERERERERQGLKYLSVRLSMILLVRILWFMLIGGWGRRRIQARLEAGPVTLGNRSLRVKKELKPISAIIANKS